MSRIGGGVWDATVESVLGVWDFLQVLVDLRSAVYYGVGFGLLTTLRRAQGILGQRRPLAPEASDTF